MPTAKEAGTIFGPLMAMMFVPFYAVSLIISDPRALIVQGFTYFPLTPRSLQCCATASEPSPQVHSRPVFLDSGLGRQKPGSGTFLVRSAPWPVAGPEPEYARARASVPGLPAALLMPCLAETATPAGMPAAELQRPASRPHGKHRARSVPQRLHCAQESQEDLLVLQSRAGDGFSSCR